MKLCYKFALVLLCLAPMALTAQTKKWDAKRAAEGWTLPSWNIKTNLLSDITTTLNLAAEFRTGGHTSIDIPVSWNPWSFNGGQTVFKHIRVQPEFRYWLKETFRGHFFGLHAGWAQYNVGGLWHGPFTQYMKDNRFEGWLAGVGVSWGHRWNFNQHWGLSTEIGVGYARLNDTRYLGRYACLQCDEKVGERKKNYFGPTKLAVNLIFGFGAKKKEVAIPEPIVVAAVEPYEPVFDLGFITPAAEALKTRVESGRAYLEYHVGKSDIVKDFRNNAFELQKIHDMVDRVKADEDATIKGIILTGHASPEGSAPSNQALSQRRAEALKTYLKGVYGMENLMTAHGSGEDWTTLAEIVNDSNLAGKPALLEVINGSDNLDARERRLAAIDGGAPYKTIRADIYPTLRRTDYLLDYEVAPITVERARAIILTNPGNLSLNEMFLVADSYPIGSEKAHEAHMIAARMYPDSDVANINAAASALHNKNTALAKTHLAKVREQVAEWHNNMGILSAMEGDYTKAADHFRRAGSVAAKNASELTKRIESLR